MKSNQIFYSFNDLHPAFRKMLEQHNTFQIEVAYENFESNSTASARGLLVITSHLLVLAYLMDEKPSTISGVPYRDIINSNVSFNQNNNLFQIDVEIIGERRPWVFWFNSEAEANYFKDQIDNK